MPATLIPVLAGILLAQNEWHVPAPYPLPRTKTFVPPPLPAPPRCRSPGR